MEELDRELRLAQDACQRLKSQVSVPVPKDLKATK